MHQGAFWMYLLSLAVIIINAAGLESYEEKVTAGSNPGNSPTDSGHKYLSSVGRAAQRGTRREVNNIKEQMKYPKYSNMFLLKPNISFQSLLRETLLNPQMPSKLWNTNSVQKIPADHIIMNKHEYHSEDAQNSFSQQNLTETSEPVDVAHFPFEQNFSARSVDKLSIPSNDYDYYSSDSSSDSTYDEHFNIHRPYGDTEEEEDKEEAQMSENHKIAEKLFSKNKLDIRAYDNLLPTSEEISDKIPNENVMFNFDELAREQKNKMDMLKYFTNLPFEPEQDEHFLVPKNDLPSYNRKVTPENADLLIFANLFSDDWKDKNDTDEHELEFNDNVEHDILTILQEDKVDEDVQPRLSGVVARRMKNEYDNVAERHDLKPLAVHHAKDLDLSTQLSARQLPMYQRGGRSSNLDQLLSEHMLQNDAEYQDILTHLQKDKVDEDVQPHLSGAVARRMKNKYDNVAERHDLKPLAVHHAKDLDLSTQLSARQPLMYRRGGQSFNLDQLPSVRMLKNDAEYQDILARLQKYKIDEDVQPHLSGVVARMMQNEYDIVAERYNLKRSALQPVKDLDVSAQLSARQLPMYQRGGRSSNLDQLLSEHMLQNDAEYQDILTHLQKDKVDEDVQPHLSGAVARMMNNKHDNVVDRHNLKPSAVQPANGLDLFTQLSAKNPLIYRRGGQSSNLDQLPSVHMLKRRDA